MFAKIKNNVIVEYPITNIKVLFPNISFPEILTNDSMPDGYVMVGASAPPSTGLTQKAVPNTPVKQGDKWVQGWDVVNLSDLELEEQNNALASAVLADRDQRLQQTDWIVTKAYEKQEPVPLAWVKYRQALRDITMQIGFPGQLDWPTHPT